METAETYYDKKWLNSSSPFQKKFFTRGAPQNLSQFFFQNQFKILRQIVVDTFQERQLQCLEVGCGRGTNSLYMSSNSMGKVVSLDYSKSAIDLTRENFELEGEQGIFLVGDCRNLPFADGSFNVVFSIGLLEHFENPENFVAEKCRLLRKGGLFLALVIPDKISMQNLNSVYKPFAILFRKIRNFIRKLCGRFSVEQKKVIINARNILRKSDKKANNGSQLYRNCLLDDFYINVLKKHFISDIQVLWVNPFVFLNPSSRRFQNALVGFYSWLLKIRKKIFGFRLPYRTNRFAGNAFYIYGIKK